MNDIFSNLNEQTEVKVHNLNSDGGSHIQTINFAEVPQPKYIESRTGEYVLNGRNHEYVRFLIELQDKSPIHKSITTGKAQMIAGEGLKIDSTNSKITESELRNLTNWFSNVNSNGESIDDVIKKCAKDFSILSYSALNIIWSKDKSRIAEIYHLDASTVSFGKNNPETHTPDFYYVSNDWSNIRKKENEPVKVPAFNPNKRADGSQIMLIKGYDTGSVYYSKPDYSAGVTYCLIDDLISKFHHANLSNGMVPSMWISFNNGKPQNEEEETKIYDEIKSAYGSASNAGKIIVTFSNTKDNAPTYQMLNPNDSDKQFLMLNDSVTSAILRSHKANPVLFQSSPGSLGQSTELRNASELFYNTVIAPIQILFEQAIDKIVKINGYEQVKLSISDLQPISFQVQDIGNYLTKDEIRQKLGYPAIQQTDADKKPLLIEILGVGGVQALQGILLAPMPADQKKNTLMIVFGLTDEQALQMVGTQDLNPLPDNKTKEQSNLTTNDNDIK